jgi:hypothetical protein
VKGRGALLLTAAALAAALGLFLHRERLIAGPVGLLGFPLDDSWIHFQFARNVAEGHGFSYNPGVPVSGSTAPLWTLLLAGLFKAAGAYPEWAKAAGVAAALGAAWLARRLALAWTGDTTLGLTAALVTAWSAPMAWGALSGMEVTLAALLVTAALVAHAAGRAPVSAALLGLAVLARPESVLLIPLLWLAGPLTAKRSAAVWGLPAVLLLPWVAFNLRTTGTPIPATAAAKIEGGLVGLLSGARESAVTTFLSRPWQFEREWIAWLASVNVLLPVLLLPGIWVLWRRGGRACALPASILLLHPLGMALLAPYRGPAFQEGRYSIQLLPLAIVVAVSAFVPLVSSAIPSVVGTGGVRAAAGRLTRLARPRRDTVCLGRAEHRRHAGGPRALGRRAHARRGTARSQRCRRDRVSRAAGGGGRHGSRDAGHHSVPPPR